MNGAPAVLCVAITPCLQRVLDFERLRPGEVNRARSVVVSAGGKAVNAARVLKILGAEPVVTGFLGGAAGDGVRRLLDRLGIGHDFVAASGATRTCVTLRDGESGVITELVEEGPSPREEELEALCRKVDALLPRCAAALAAGALPPGAPPDLYARLAALAAARGIPFLLDARGPALLEALAYRPLLAKLNREEFALAAGACAGPAGDPLFAVRGLLRRGAGWALVTDGPRPALLAGGGGGWRLVPPRVEEVSGVGSGDAATAGIAFGLSTGLSMVEAARLGMACGAANAATLVPGELSVAEAQRLRELVRVFPLEQ